jgi:hypothetical protein
MYLWLFCPVYKRALGVFRESTKRTKLSILWVLRAYKKGESKEQALNELDELGEE